VYPNSTGSIHFFLGSFQQTLRGILVLLALGLRLIACFSGKKERQWSDWINHNQGVKSVEQHRVGVLRAGARLALRPSGQVASNRSLLC